MFADAVVLFSHPGPKFCPFSSFPLVHSIDIMFSIAFYLFFLFQKLCVSKTTPSNQTCFLKKIFKDFIYLFLERGEEREKER